MASLVLLAKVLMTYRREKKCLIMTIMEDNNISTSQDKGIYGSVNLDEKEKDDIPFYMKMKKIEYGTTFLSQELTSCS